MHYPVMRDGKYAFSPGDLADTTDTIRKILAELATLAITWDATDHAGNIAELRGHVIDGLSNTTMLEGAVEAWTAERREREAEEKATSAEAAQ